MNFDRSQEKATELAKAIGDDFAEVLRRRLAIAQHVYSPPEQAIAVGLATEALIETSMSLAAACVPPPLQATSVAMVADCMRSALERRQHSSLRRMAELLAEFKRGGGEPWLTLALAA